MTTTEAPANRRLTHEEAAHYLGIAPGTLRVWRCTKRYQIAFYKIGNRVHYDQRDLDAWLDFQRVDPSQD